MMAIKPNKMRPIGSVAGRWVSVGVVSDIFDIFNIFLRASKPADKSRQSG